MANELPSHQIDTEGVDMSDYLMRSPDQLRWEEAERRYVENGRNGNSSRKCRANFEKLVRLFSSDKLLAQVAAELRVNRFAAMKLYAYVRDLCGGETITQRSRRLAKVHRERQVAAVVAQPWHPRAQQVADLARAAGCVVEPIIQFAPHIRVHANDLKINGHHCFIHRLPRSHRVRFRVLPNAHPVSYRILCFIEDGHIATLYAVPNRIFEPHVIDRSTTFRIRPITGDVKVGGVSLDFRPYLITDRLDRWPEGRGCRRK